MTKWFKILNVALVMSALFVHGNVFTQSNEIELIYAKAISDFPGHKNVTQAVGNVQFKHDRTKLFCDSSLFFRDKEIVKAYGNVQINQGDTINLFCDSMIYNGKTNISNLYGNVRFRDNEYKMVTDSLEYDGNRSMGYYQAGAVVTAINSKLKLTSIKGYYHSEQKTFFFKDSVHVTDEGYELISDTLEFRTKSNSAHFHGPTQIHLDSSDLFCTKGIYWTDKKFIRLWNGATLIDKDHNFYADSLLYNQDTDIGEGFCNVNLYDSTENTRFLSDYLWKSPKNENVILKDNARVLSYSETDTFYLAADTIRYHQDTLTKMSNTIAENNVHIVNGDMIIRSDSAWYSEQDSLMKLHKEPIMWSDQTQMSADSIYAVYFNNEFHELYMYDNAFITTEHDSIHYDQIKGKEMTAYIDSSKIQSVHIKKNAQTLYYIEEETTDSLGFKQKELGGLNKIDCNEIIIYFDSSKVDKIVFLDQPTSVFYPMDLIPSKELFLKGFKWEIDRKPEDIYLE